MNQTLFSRKESEDHSPVLCTRNSRGDIQRLRFANHRLSGRARFLPLNARMPEKRPHSRGDPAHEAEPVRRGAARVLAMSPPRRPASHGVPRRPHPSHAPGSPRWPLPRARAPASPPHASDPPALPGSRYHAALPPAALACRSLAFFQDFIARPCMPLTDTSGGRPRRPPQASP